MPPKKRAAEAKSSPSRVTRSSLRVTRSTVKPNHEFRSITDKDKSKKNKRLKRAKKEGEGSASVGSAKVEGEASGEAVKAEGRIIVIEHCKQCNSFKTRANQVKVRLESDCNVTVKVNPEKPRKGCFEIREEGGKTFISLLDMKRPFKPMKDLDMGEVISDIIEEISNDNNS